MKPNYLIASLLALIVCTPAFGEEAAFAWKGSDLGGGQPTGSHTWDGRTLTVTGAGVGLNVKNADQVHFVHVGRPAGDFEAVVRLVDFSGEEEGRAGIMARADNCTPGANATDADDRKPEADVTAAMATVSFLAQDNGLGWMSRVPRIEPPAAPQIFSGGINLANKPPLWLRMARLGKNFAVYKSRDGRLWSMISNVSGGPIAIDGPLQLGVFVSSGTEDKTVTAAFDSIAIGAPQMRYQTSWVGNTFGSREEDKHVSNTISAMWVAPDGTCYTSSYWDEGGRPVTSYRDGRAARGLPIGTPQTAEGAITGDATRLFVAAVDRIIQLDPAKPDFAPQPLCLSRSLLDKGKNHSVVSGLASDGRRLFVADSRENVIRIVAVAPELAPQKYHEAQAANDGVIFAPQTVVVPQGDPRLAPAVVYQTQRGGEGNRYTLPGFTPGREYTVRGHFVEYVDRPANCDPRNRFIVVNGVEVRVADLAGGVLKPLVKDFPHASADAGGNLSVTHGAYGGPGICGFEVLDSDGTRLFAINCGGPPTGEFRGECPELVDQAFPFERPGPMAVDKRGDLWIIQCGNDFPIGGLPAAKYQAAVRCHKPDGTFTGRQITDVVNPRALGYDAANDRLLVGENGPDLNVRIYARLDSHPVLAETFGEQGGIYAGENPGQVHAPSAGGSARFAGISGVGVDDRGNLYVGGGFQGSDLRMFTPDGKLGWMLYSLMFCNTYDVDPASDGTELYGTYNHIQLDLGQTEPGREQRYVGYNWDLRRLGEPDRASNSQAIVRRLGSEKRLTMFTSGQGNIGDIKIFRYDGELAIPAGGTREHGNVLWIDANGNGRDDPEELTKMVSPIGWITGLCVDARGDLWAANATTGGCFMRHFFFQGLTAQGVPSYSGVKDEGYKDIRFPEEGDTTNAWGMACRMDYDADRDILVAYYPAVPRTGEGDTSPAQYYFGRYDNWSKGNRTPHWKQQALEPQRNPDFFMYEKNLFPYRGYMGMQIAGDYVFFAYLFGEVHVFDLETGQLVEILAHGPEVNGQSAWEDAAMGLRAFRRKNGEYLIFTENSGWGGKNNFFRWRP